MEFEVESINIEGEYSDYAYIGDVYDIALEGSKEMKNIEFHIANENGKCVISYCDWCLKWTFFKFNYEYKDKNNKY